MALSQEEEHIIRDGGTEPPFSGALLYEHSDGMFHCKQCGAALFASGSKFDSGSGWPSFTEPDVASAVRLVDDSTLGMNRTEVRCAACDGHLGHVFDDGPRDRGGQRYCINSLSLSFEPKTDKR